MRWDGDRIARWVMGIVVVVGSIWMLVDSFANPPEPCRRPADCTQGPDPYAGSPYAGIND